MRQDFLDHLAATANVKASAAEIEVDPRSVYNLRRRDPKFVEEWDEALALGYQMLETRLIGHVLASDGRCDTLDPDEFEAIDVELALSMLGARRAVLANGPRKVGPKFKRVTEEETNAALLKKLDAIEKRRRGAQA